MPSGRKVREIRRIFRYPPGPCVPPEPDVSEIYEEAIRVKTHLFGVEAPACSREGPAPVNQISPGERSII